MRGMSDPECPSFSLPKLLCLSRLGYKDSVMRDSFYLFIILVRKFDHKGNVKHINITFRLGKVRFLYDSYKRIERIIFHHRSQKSECNHTNNESYYG